MRVAAVIPAYNEAGRIGEVIRSVSGLVDDVIVVDDGSEDSTAEEAAGSGAVVLRHAINRGQGAAIRTGNAAALLRSADVVVHFDADGQHDPGVIDRLVEPVRNGEVDVVYGSRFLGERPEGMPSRRRWLLRAARLFSVTVLGVPDGFTDPQSGLRAMSAEAVRILDFRQDRMAHCSEMLMMLGRTDLRWREIPTKVYYTPETLTKGQKAVDALRIVWNLMLGALE